MSRQPEQRTTRGGVPTESASPPTRLDTIETPPPAPDDDLEALCKRLRRPITAKYFDDLARGGPLPAIDGFFDDVEESE